jgi:hypothetical protein
MVADRLLRIERDAGRSLTRAVLVINAAEVDLERLEHIPREHRFRIGQTDERVEDAGSVAT